jgi:hypothetical protein
MNEPRKRCPVRTKILFINAPERGANAARTQIGRPTHCLPTNEVLVTQGYMKIFDECMNDGLLGAWVSAPPTKGVDSSLDHVSTYSARKLLHLGAHELVDE